MKKLPEIITHEVLVAIQEEFITLFIGEWGRREKDMEISYAYAKRMLCLCISDREVVFRLPGANSDMTFAIFAAIEKLCDSYVEPKPFPSFSIDSYRNVLGIIKVIGIG